MARILPPPMAPVEGSKCIWGGGTHDAQVATNAARLWPLTGISAKASVADSWKANVLIVVAGTLKNLYAWSDNNIPAGSQRIITVTKNETPTSLQVIIENGQNGNDLTHTVTVSPADRIAIRTTGVNIPGVNRLCWGAEFASS